MILKSILFLHTTEISHYNFYDDDDVTHNIDLLRKEIHYAETIYYIIDIILDQQKSNVTYNTQTHNAKHTHTYIYRELAIIFLLALITD